MRILIILTIFIAGRVSDSVTNNPSEQNNEVLILSLLIQDHLRKTDGREISLEELLQADTLNRISKSFKEIDLKYKGGHISVYYRFSESRGSKGIELLDNEKKRAKYFRWKEKNLKNQYDGEIQLENGERFYKVIKLIHNTAN